MLCAGCDYVYGSFYLGSADKANVSGGVLTKTIPLTASAAGAWDGTTKTQPTLTDGVYQIGTAAELAWFAAQVNGGSYAINGALTGDIDLAGYNWTPIGGTTASTAFKGSFDGKNHTVKNMGIYYSATTTSAPYKGLFGYVNGTSSSYATIQNLKVTGKMYLTSTGSVANAYSGGVVAYANYTNISGVISDVGITVTRVNGNWSSVGGVAGRLVNSNATNCGNEGTIHGYQYAGGITGYATGTITGCYNGGEITGNGYVAGIVGQTTKAVTSCYNIGSVTGNSNYVGGIVANASGASITYSYNRGVVKGTGDAVGAVAGQMNNASSVTTNTYYLQNSCSKGIGIAKTTSQVATVKTAYAMTEAAGFYNLLNASTTDLVFVPAANYPILMWQVPAPTVGDVNLDGVVDEMDLIAFQEIADGNYNNIPTDVEAQADLDGNGVVNAEDLELMSNYNTGVIYMFPVDDPTR